MFKVKEHDFGSVARGAKVEYHFGFENLYMEDVHISMLTRVAAAPASKIENPLVKTYEKGRSWPPSIPTRSTANADDAHGGY